MKDTKNTQKNKPKKKSIKLTPEQESKFRKFAQGSVNSLNQSARS